ncbi:uncharacterized protein LOC129596613 [Paramacrobiotus metropolitanus]|uniref:uncharacterized protein LOC129596613 n=1 Tax=Paramacrobiotus metropolitanus TaxID=2943436 RepID=UPI002445ABB1|nr:uncharacterized protein LOC129596613 [Paramacrobiotus metropolitanus]
MLILTKGQLTDILPTLEGDFPRSLSIYHMVRNTVRGKFAWPGMEFVVDAFPDFSVCICRPRDDRKDYVPLINIYDVLIYSKDANVLRKILFECPNTLDWTNEILFEDIMEPEYLVLLEDGQGFRGGSFDHLVVRDGFPPGKVAYSFDLPNLNLECSVPPGFRLGSLGVEHVAQIARERSLGNPENTEKHLRYLIEHGFLTAALFVDGQNEPIAHCVYRPEGALGAGYVDPAYRKRGFYQLVLKALLRTLRDMGEINVWVNTMRFNTTSQQSMAAVGGKEFKGHPMHVIIYTPANS